MEQRAQQQEHERTSGDPKTPNTIDQLIQLDAGDIVHVVQDGEPNAPALLLDLAEFAGSAGRANG